MDNLLKDERFKDITFKCMDGEIKAHKAVLAASENMVFKTMFSGNFTIPDVIEYPFAKVLWMEMLLMNIYTKMPRFIVGCMDKFNTLTDDMKDISNILYFAEYFDFSDLRKILESKIRDCKIERLGNDIDFDKFLSLISDSSNLIVLGMKVDSESIPWILNKVYNEKMYKNELFMNFLRNSYLCYDNCFKDILMHPEVNNEIFVPLFDNSCDRQSDENILHFVARNLLDLRTAYIISRIRGIIKMKNHNGKCQRNKIQDFPLKYEFTFEISYIDRCNVFVDFSESFKGLNPIFKVMNGDKEEDETSIEEFYYLAKTTPYKVGHLWIKITIS